ncbi:MAG: hypothetical protein E5X88_21050 [Mesorhizobium sp.]|uniref:hypothetical protein n=1 Tax=Mesorhizobium sp. TaxID=1871066 RepID=UPI00122B61B2|nr:hypothetical protein [Mesorhizobium sp.]TIO06905.1 MAG: hypothetical protein E5X88_21050 [Mesorhizobium sp.]
MTEIADDLKALTTLMNALQRFNQFDPKMQVSTVLTLLEIAAAEEADKEISVQDIERQVGLQSGTASRNCYYWAEGHKDMTGGHEMVRIDFDRSDRRKRSLTLTNKGRAFIRSLASDLRKRV